jgi:hypothetical protein
MLKTKMVHLKSLKKYILQRSNEAMWEKIILSAIPDGKSYLERPIVVNNWLDYNIWWKLLEVTDQLMGAGDGRIIQEVGAFDAKESLTGIYQIFLSIASPSFIISQSQILWRRYYDSGEMCVIMVNPESTVLHLQGISGMPLHHEWELIGWMKTALELAGAKKPQIQHTTCLAKGEAYCTFLASWS